MNIENGDPEKFQFIGQVSLCNVNFFNLPNDTIDFEMVHTGVPTTKTFSLKNETNRVVTAYQIQNPLPEILQFKEVAGYLTDKAKSVEVTITHKEPNPEFYAEVPILIRGGPKLLLKLLFIIIIYFIKFKFIYHSPFIFTKQKRYVVKHTFHNSSNL